MKDIYKTKAQLISELNLLREQQRCLESMEIKTEHSDQIQDILNNLVAISLKKYPIKRILEEFIDQLTSLTWLALESKGGIFLLNNEAGMLELEAYRALPRAALETCARVPLGRCLCGRAALSGKCLFADRIDERHENRYPNMAPHGHYCVPIISSGNQVIGVITLYLKEGHCRNKTEETFLITAAQTLAGIIELKKVEYALRERSRELEIENRNAEDANIALKVLLKKREEDKKEFENSIRLNIATLIEPHLERLRNSRLTSRQRAHLELLESNLLEITSSFAHRLSYRFKKLTPVELQVANLVKHGKSTKEIATFLYISDQTVGVHRRNIRKKLGLKNRKINLGTHLLSTFE